jgi:hypothetical protein
MQNRLLSLCGLVDIVGAKPSVVGGSLALALLAGIAQAQAPVSRPVWVAGGLTALTPESDLMRRPGGHLQIGVTRRVTSNVISTLRLDAGYHSLESRILPGETPPSAGVVIAMASMTRDLGSVVQVRPYLVAGVGTIMIDQGGGREAHLNFAGGLGLTLPQVGRVRPFVEARFHRAMTGMPNSFIPVSLGVSF